MSRNEILSQAEIAQYEAWEQAGLFSADVMSAKTPFAIMIPPPNVTGNLHLGHALTYTLQDVIIRWRRMQGSDALWMPGTDHAGIATQMVVERQLAAQDIDRKTMGRDDFIARVWQWKEESGGQITRQLRRLGASLDWPRERFTMDDGLSTAVRKAFTTLYDQGLIYRDHRLVNWDPRFQSAISDLEVETRETKGSMWYINYPLDGRPGEFITIATTRPETMLGDTAIAVHPTEGKYAHLIGAQAILPLTGRPIPIVGDTYSDPEKGTGAVKITPAHDFNDFEVGKRHGLATPSILDATGCIMLDEITFQTIDGIADSDFVQSLAGQDRFAARKLIVAELERLGLLDKIEPHVSQLPVAERGGTVIEPRLTTQWYCNAGELAGPAIAAVEKGSINFVPKQAENTFYAWMKNIQPWCISRQLWWGHRIPAWYGPDGAVFVAETESEAQTQAATHYGNPVVLTQDEDVLDTWFSSALWPFSTLGWPEKTPELVRYYPTDVLITGFDIIFFWVARMMMMGLHFMGDVPFRTVHLHGMVRDEHGQKMSKSKGNGLDPLDLIEAYGTDALRWTITSDSTPGRDVKLGVQRVELARTFVTKLRNAAKFCDFAGFAPVPGFDPATATLPLSRWLLGELNTTIAETTTALGAFRYDDYADTLYRFTWNTYCDWFIELAKLSLDGDDAVEIRAVGAYALGILLRLLHPVLPFVTEELWQQFGIGDTHLITAAWPTAIAVNDAAAARAEIDWTIRFITAIRAVRSEMNVPNSAIVPVFLRDASPTTLVRVNAWATQIKCLTRTADIAALDGDMPGDAAQTVVDEATLILPLAGVIDLDAERVRLTKELAKAEANVAKITGQLANDNFVARAPAAVIDENRAQLAASQGDVTRLKAALERIA